MKAQRIVRKGRSKKMLKAGDKAPDFRLQADDKREITLAEFLGKPVVLYFFPKALTSG